jgi:hypothetical protein
MQNSEATLAKNASANLDMAALVVTSSRVIGFATDVGTHGIPLRSGMAMNCQS